MSTDSYSCHLSGFGTARQARVFGYRGGHRYGLPWFWRLGSVGIAFCYLLVSTLIHSQHTCIHNCWCAGAHSSVGQTAQGSCSCHCGAKSECACGHGFLAFSCTPLATPDTPDATENRRQPTPKNDDDCPACRFLSIALSPGVPPPISMPEVFCAEIVCSTSSPQSPAIFLLRPNSRAPPLNVSSI